MRSHAQKVLKDYSPNSGGHDDRDDLSKGELTEHLNNESMSIAKENTVRTEEPNLRTARFDFGQPQASIEDVKFDQINTDLK